ncbi:nucleotidyltransferase domain-containing protein [Paenibacillus favisporus]|uniref:nucleotidyltransferase domain-containing protein n=1 Tax=Paenibacillus favisporus TaxID=221028 RepID=UPI00398B116E
MQKVIRNIEQAKQTFETWGIEWAICGGMAIDISLGEETRKHYDLDLFVLWSDKRKIIELILKDDWRVFEACGNGVVQELLIATQATENHRNLFCFNRDERRVSLEYISEQAGRVHEETHTS